MTTFADTNDIIDSARLSISLVVAYFIMDGIHPDDGIHLVKGTVAPGLKRGEGNKNSWQMFFFD